MRTVSAAELSRLSSARQAVVRMPQPEPTPAQAPQAAPPVPQSNDKLAEALLQLSNAIQALKPAEPARHPEWMQTEPARAVDPIVMPAPAPMPERVTRFAVTTNADGLLMSVAAGDSTYSVARDEDGVGLSIVRAGSDGSSTYRIYRGAGGRISSVSLTGQT